MTTAARAIAVFVFTLAAGCSNNAKVEVADLDASRAALDAALGAWRDGKTESELLSATPPLRATLDEWRKSGSLAGYEVMPGETVIGFDRRYLVKVRLKDSAGRESPREWPFLVGTKPGLIVLHETEM